MRRFAGMVIAAMVLFGTGISTLAQPGPSREGPRWMGNRDFGLVRMLHDPSMRAKFGISDDQYTKLRSAFLDSSKAAIRGQADLKIKRLELANLMDADKVDRAQVDQKINEISALQGALMKNHIGTRLVVKETLTPDQLNKISEWRQSQARRFMEDRMQGRMGMMQRQQRPGMRPQQPPPPEQPPAPSKPGDSSSQ